MTCNNLVCLTCIHITFLKFHTQKNLFRTVHIVNTKINHTSEQHMHLTSKIFLESRRISQSSRDTTQTAIARYKLYEVSKLGMTFTICVRQYSKNGQVLLI